MKGVHIVSAVILIVSVMMNFCNMYETDSSKLQYKWDDHGYVLYCPCTGETEKKCLNIIMFLNPFILM